MTARWRNVCFFVLAIAFVIWIDRFSILARTKYTQYLEPRTQSQAARARRPALAISSRASARLVPLYPSGDVLVSKPKKQPKSKTASRRPQSAKTSRASPPPTPKKEGNRPVLEVGYEQIGFANYLEIIERVGRFFVLLNTEKGSRLGPEISLDRSILSTHGSDLQTLAVNRPHLVSDPKVQERLASIKLPPEAIEDRVVLVLNKPFDAMLWDAIAETLSKRGISLEDVRLVSGAYVNGKNGVFLRLDKALTKDGRRKIPLKRKIRVTLL